MTNMQYDSRKIKPGDTFVAVPGEHVDGREYMQAAVDAGAAEIFYEADGIEKFQLPQSGIPCTPINNLSKKQAEMSAEFYGHPSKQLNMTGVTGTNGKTSVASFVAQCLQNTAMIGTTGYGKWNALKGSKHTTPMAIDVQRLLKNFVDTDYERVIMEVSSHALEQHRVGAIDFNIGVFTNLSRDHLDYHGNMSAYANAKKQLFLDFPLKHAVVNIDDPIGQEIAAEVNSLTYSIAGAADIMASQITLHEKGVDCVIDTPWGGGECFIPLRGRFNIANCLAVIGVLGCLNVSFEKIIRSIAQLKNPSGRMMQLSYPDRPKVVIDYAHTPDALAKSLQALREHFTGKIFCVFGCGGGRDRGKRVMMGEAASSGSDYLIVTNDNPRFEDPIQIAADVCKGIAQSKPYDVVLDRALAIEQAISLATTDDVVLVAGKGHETYQLTGDKVLPFNDATVVNEILEKT